MNIVHCAFEMETGGSEVLVVGLLNEMCKSHTVSLIIINNQYNKSLLKQLNSKVKIYCLNRRQGSYNPLPFIKLNRLLYIIRPQIIHCHEYITSLYIRIKTGKLVNTVHSIGLPVKYYHHYNLIAAISPVVSDDVHLRCSCPVVTISNGINVDDFAQRKTYTYEETNTWRIVQVGRLDHKMKVQDIMIHALYSIIHDYGITNVSLDFIGSGKSLAYLQTLVNRLSLGNYVHFKGDKERDWLFNHLAGYHLLVQPSRLEGFGLAMLEGVAAGLPVLASNVPGPADIISGIPCGFLFSPGNVADCAKQIESIFSLYKNNNIITLINESVNRVKNTYSLTSCAAAYLKAYDQVINNA